ncbi:ATP-binding protein [Paenibacillus polysaccharolyticus]|uniref:ATP-binding protein n=1 Tax=Paenibacillus polysaccharolyticus TaxID=582692 RepID=UPI00209F1766|nr:ATP-binding protein [Paenibacillus polysaccharolyticus]MCP1133293.1 ATP-binding protein [Paenibacillus polysaccharolyticus]
MINQGDVYVVRYRNELNTRPAIVVTKEEFNKGSTLLMAPLFTRSFSNYLVPGIKLLAEKYEWIHKDTYLNLFLTTPVSRIDLDRFIFRIDYEDCNLLKRSWKSIVEEEDLELKKDKITTNLFFVNQSAADIEDEDRTTECKNVPENDDVSDFVSKRICKYISGFLNSIGGRILFGIENNTFIVRGVKLNQAQKDQLRTKINNAVRTRIQPAIDPTSIHVAFHQVFENEENVIKDLYVLEVLVNKTNDIKLFFDQKIPYVRVDGDCVPLEGPAITDWIMRRQSKFNN